MKTSKFCKQEMGEYAVAENKFINQNWIYKKHTCAGKAVQVWKEIINKRSRHVNLSFTAYERVFIFEFRCYWNATSK